MSEKTAIEWTDTTWNPVTGCTKVSPGCANCYIDRTPPFRMAGRKFERGHIPVILHPERLEQPLRWLKPRRIFVNSLSDLFHESVPERYILEVFDVMARANQHTFQVLTKRPARMRAIMQDRAAVREGQPKLPGGYGWLRAEPWPLPNVWLGVTAENQRFADERIPILLDTPAAVRFVSLEPLLGPIDLRPEWLTPTISACTTNGVKVSVTVGPLTDLARAAARSHLGWSGLDWVIVGGESGGPADRQLIERCHEGTPPIAHIHTDGHDVGHRYCSGWQPKLEALEWVRWLRDQCQSAGVPFLFKQWGGPRPKSGGRMLDGRTWDEYPA